jgi:hypothetical protein
MKCVCPVHPNNAGTKEPEGGWHVNALCPLHSPTIGRDDVIHESVQMQIPDEVLRPKGRMGRMLGKLPHRKSSYVPIPERMPEIPPGDPIREIERVENVSLSLVDHPLPGMELRPEDVHRPDPRQIEEPVLPPVAVATGTTAAASHALMDSAVPPQGADEQAALETYYEHTDPRETGGEWGKQVVQMRRDKEATDVIIEAWDEAHAEDTMRRLLNDLTPAIISELVADEVTRQMDKRAADLLTTIRERRAPAKKVAKKPAKKAVKKKATGKKETKK